MKLKIEELKSATLKEVFLGEKAIIRDYPVAFILPRPYNVRTGFSGLEEHPITVDIIIAHQGFDFEQGVRDAVDVAADCRDKLYEDKTLGGKCSDLSVASFGPSYELREKVWLFQSVLRVVCTIALLE